MSEDFSPGDLTRRDTERIRGYKELLDFYQSTQWDGRARWGERRLTFNYARVVIDKITSYLMSGMEFDIEPVELSKEAADRARRAEESLYQVHQENSIEQLDFETEIDCAVLGDACYKVIWDPGTKGVRVTSPDVHGIYTWRMGDDSSRLWRLASRYTLSADEIELLHGIRPQGKEGVVVELWTDNEFELWLNDTRLEKKPNPYGFIPFVVFPNLREPKNSGVFRTLSR